jgi:hypothetical protein
MESTQWPQQAEKPLPPAPPSPTLSNVDMVLPDSTPVIDSPSRWGARPPSLSYLRDADGNEHNRYDGNGTNGHKMMLLRNRPAPGAYNNARVSPTSAHMEQDGSFVASSPLLRDVPHTAGAHDFLQLPQPSDRSPSGSSSGDMAGLSAFLAKYEKTGGASDDETNYDSEATEAAPRTQTSFELKNDVDAQRRKQQEEEQNSAILSKRAEEILSDAKKRLHRMEGNLRGARDLLPLTAANLQRAASMGSSHHHTLSYSRNTYEPNSYDHGRESPAMGRRLHSQASSPTISRDFINHSRGLSANEIPDRPHTSFEHPLDATYREKRQMSRTPEPPSSNALRSIKSYSSLGENGFPRRSSSREQGHRSPTDFGYLEPLQEDGENRVADYQPRSETPQGSIRYMPSRPSSRASSIREQMSTLKGKITSLREKAREESLRRQSRIDSRSSPLNNASSAAPDLWYNATPAATSEPSQAGLGNKWYADKDANASNPTTPQFESRSWENVTASAPRDIESHHDQQKYMVDRTDLQISTSKEELSGDLRHTSSEGGSAEGHELAAQSKVDTDMIHQTDGHLLQDDDVLDQSLTDSSNSSTEEAEQSSESSSGDEISEASAAVEDNDNHSVYEDAPNDHKVMAHEDREDKFDYQNFLLQSASARYYPGRRGSDSESDTSVSSAATERGPRAGHNEHDDDLPSSPQTPERLREIERNILHHRTLSAESIRSSDTFATADEGTDDEEHMYQPHHPPARRGTMNQSFALPLQQYAPSPSRPENSRPSTAVNTRMPGRRNSSSDRADSGVGGLSQRSLSSVEPRRPHSSATHSAQHKYEATNTPPLSPQSFSAHDPAIVAVNALLNPHGKALGLRSKAALYSCMESLRQVALRLQEEDEAQYDSRVLRRRIDDATNALNGV